MQEAHAMCPEGADLSETYHRDAHVPNVTAGTARIMPTLAGRWARPAILH